MRALLDKFERHMAEVRASVNTNSGWIQQTGVTFGRPQEITFHSNKTLKYCIFLFRESKASGNLADIVVLC